MSKTFQFDVAAAGRLFDCQYWPGAANEDRILAQTAPLPGDGWTACGSPVRRPVTLEIYFGLRDWAATVGKPISSPFTVGSQATPLFARRVRTYGVPPQRYEFWDVLPEISQAIVSALVDTLRADSDWPPRLAASLAAARADVLGEGAVNAAMLAFAESAESEAFSADNAAAAFAATGARLDLEGRPRSEAPTREQLLAAHPPIPQAAPVYECLECGYTTGDESQIESGGMGCVRCSGGQS